MQISVSKITQTAGRSLGLKLLLVCFLVIMMSVPALFIGMITYDRSSRAKEVTREVSERYGGEQVLLGPVLVMPYYFIDQFGDVTERGEYVVFAEDGHVEISDIITTVRKRSLYKVPTYEANPVFTAKFSLGDKGIGEKEIGAKLKEGRTGELVWESAKILVGISDMGGLRDDVYLTLPNGAKHKFEPAGLGEDVTFGDVKQKVRQRRTFQSTNVLQYMQVSTDNFVETHTGDFNIGVNMHLSGSTRLSVVSFAKSTTVNMVADWPHPGFKGRYAPHERSINGDGFHASWVVPYLARGVRSAGPAHTLGVHKLLNDTMSVVLVNPVSPYQNVTRALKYSVLFIGIVFIAYFLFEVVVGVRVHAAQYVLIGLTQCIFYLLLLAFAEHVGFSIAFAIASLATIGATAGYAGAVFGGRRYCVRAMGVFSLVYGLLYVLMRMEDFALMVGALMAFVTIAATMYLTRNVNWYADSTLRE
ncbi:MAG: cell envelope integrity protein CreD [Robiginitomaculum sp.]|nr:MAG: cell envelope integrity protein CreD [Robiginitomaculum sp.]